MQSRARGFSLLELAVVACVLSVLLAVLLNRLTFYQEAAERAQFESTLQTYKTALQIRLAELMLERREAEVRTLETGNPAELMAEKPANYGGDYPASPQSGTWYFDYHTHELVYIVNTGDRLSLVGANGPQGAGSPKQLRFKVRVIYQPISAPGGKVNGIAGIMLMPGRVYQWP